VRRHIFWLSQNFYQDAWISGKRKSIFGGKKYLVTFDLELWSPLEKVAAVHKLQAPIRFFKLS
jgi:hypothetical protein